MSDKQQALHEEYQSVMVPNYAPVQPIPVKGEGSRLWDAEGNEYIDFAGGIAVNCLGHSHPALVKAVNEQSTKLWHLSNVYANEPAIALAKKLTESTFAEQVYFCNSGAEANEAALKLARRAAFNQFGESKQTIISFKQSFHGRTFFTVSVGGQPSYSDGFGPKPAGIVHLDYNDSVALEALFNDNVCAVMVEPIQGEGGVIGADPLFLQRIRELCDKHHSYLIMDEVQTGMGRTGHLFAYMDSGVVPDILTSAKSLGGGFPIGAMLTTKSIGQHLAVGTHGSTYGGNPLACAVGCAVFDVVNQAETLEGVTLKSQKFIDGLQKINAKYHIFKDIRAFGLLIGCELEPQYSGKSKEILLAAIEQGLMILVAGANVIRFTPSLIISEQEIELGLAKLDNAIANWLKTIA